MISQSEVRSLALFFFFACLDEFRAKEMASKVSDDFEKNIKKTPSVDRELLLIRLTTNAWTAYRDKLPRGRFRFSPDSGWKLPANLDLSHWKEFQKNAPEDELVAVIWVKILGFSEHKISQAVGLTEGTIRYRLGRGLRKLGGYLHSPARNLRAVE